MTIKIIKSTEPILTENLIIVLYGSPGVGKTSLGFSTNKPLLIDCDLGVQRALPTIKKDCVQVRQWSDISELSKEDLIDFNTIIIDTGGRLLEIMESHIKNENPKMINRMNGGLSLPGYGQLNTMFKSFMSKLKSYEKDIILIMHDKEDKNGDNIFVRPDAIGSSKNEITKIADLMGYIFMNGKTRYIDFNPTENHLGKNCAEISEQKIPNLAEYKEFLADLIAFTKNKMNAKNEDMIKAEQEFDEVLHQICLAEIAEDFDKLLTHKLIAGKAGNKILKQKLLDEAKANGLVYHIESKSFSPIIPIPESVAPPASNVNDIPENI